MSDRRIRAQPLTSAAFEPFGDVLAAEGSPSFAFNGGMAQRFHDLARTECQAGGRIGVSIALSEPYSMPLALTLLERHPLGSQAFFPLSPDPFLVIVAPHEAGGPGQPQAFLSAPGQGVNYLRNTWHGVLTPLGRTASFIVVDRIGPEVNLEEHHLTVPWTVEI